MRIQFEVDMITPLCDVVKGEQIVQNSGFPKVYVPRGLEYVT